MELTLETIKTARPAYVNVFPKADAEGNMVDKYGIDLAKMVNGDNVTLKITSNPAEWVDHGKKFGPSYLGFFQLPDGTPVTMFVKPGSKTPGVGKNLLQRFQEFKEGDTVKLTLEVKDSKGPNAKGATWKCFVVEPVDFQ